MPQSGMISTVVKIIAAAIALLVIWVVVSPFLPGIKEKVAGVVDEIQKDGGLAGLVGSGDEDQQEDNGSDLPKTGTVTDVAELYVLQLQSGEQVRLIGTGFNDRVAQQKLDEALEFLRSSLAGEAVRFEYDEEGGHRDFKGNPVVYVYRHRDDLDINSELFRLGFAFVDLNYPFTRSDEMFGYAAEAHQAGMGFWEGIEPDEPQSPSQPQVEDPIDATFFLIKDNPNFHAMGCRLMGRGRKRKLKSSDGVMESEARAQGMKFCVVCGIDIGNVVYVEGRTYHRRSCSRLSEESYASRRAFARQRKIKPCDRCF